MFKRVTEYFNKLQQEKQDKKDFAADIAKLEAAVKAGDNTAVTDLYKKVEASPQMTWRAYDALLWNTLTADNAPAFDLFFAKQKNPDYTFHNYDSMPDGPSFSSQYGILYAAITSGAKTIALSLAKNPQVPVDKSGYSETSTYHKGEVIKKRTDYALPLDVAEKNKMPEVAAAIADRMALSYTNRATKARASVAPTAP